MESIIKEREDCYYFIRGNLCVNERNMRDAFQISKEKDESYDAWLKKLQDRGNIVKIVKESEAALCELAEQNRIAAAIEYRKRTGCTIREAKDYIDTLRKELNGHEND